MLIVLLGILVLVPASILFAQEKPRWQAEWEKTLEAAKREGRVNVYVDYAASPVIDSGAFQNAFPEIKVSSVAIRDSQIRILAERRAGKHIPDVNIAGITQNYPDLYNARALDPVKPALILPEVVDESKWWQGRHRYADLEERYVFIFLGFPQEGSFRYNTKLVNPAEFRSLWDFLNPRWKGKVIVRDPAAEPCVFSTIIRSWGRSTSGAFTAPWGRLFFRDQRQAMDWLATGNSLSVWAVGGPSGPKRRGFQSIVLAS
jgi:ABC-type Fe3+ transport system substrate-binding protein